MFSSITWGVSGPCGLFSQSNVFIHDSIENVTLSLYQLAAILDLWVKMMSQRQTDVRIGILVVYYPQKVYSHMNLGALVQK